MTEPGTTGGKPKRATKPAKAKAAPKPAKARLFRHLESTKVRRHLCDVCRRWTLAAIDEGAHVVVDRQPVTPAEEIDALVRGLHTYALMPSGQLAYRDNWRIAGMLTGKGIYVQHRCASGLNGRD